MEKLTAISLVRLNPHLFYLHAHRGKLAFVALRVISVPPCSEVALSSGERLVYSDPNTGRCHTVPHYFCKCRELLGMGKAGSRKDWLILRDHWVPLSRMKSRGIRMMERVWRKNWSNYGVADLRREKGRKGTKVTLTPMFIVTMKRETKSKGKEMYQSGSFSLSLSHSLHECVCVCVCFVGQAGG